MSRVIVQLVDTDPPWGTCTPCRGDTCEECNGMREVPLDISPIANAVYCVIVAGALEHAKQLGAIAERGIPF